MFICSLIFIIIFSSNICPHLFNTIPYVAVLTWFVPSPDLLITQAPCLNCFFGGLWMLKMSNYCASYNLDLWNNWQPAPLLLATCRDFDTNLLTTHAPTYMHVHARDLESCGAHWKIGPFLDSLMRMFLWTWPWPGELKDTPSIFYHCWMCTDVGSCLEPVPAVIGRMWGTPWTSHQFATGPTWTDKQARSHLHLQTVH